MYHDRSLSVGEADDHTAELGCIYLQTYQMRSVDGRMCFIESRNRLGWKRPSCSAPTRSSSQLEQTSDMGKKEVISGLFSYVLDFCSWSPREIRFIYLLIMLNLLESGGQLKQLS